MANKVPALDFVASVKNHAGTAIGARAPIALLSDFGYQDHYAGVMRGVISSIAPRAPIIDITHGIPPQNILAGALALRESWRYFPAQTIFLAVVDPGVGTQRRAIAIETRSGARLVGPDNGLLWMAAEQAGFRRAVELRSTRHFLPRQSSTFHGRDVLSPVSAHLWNGVGLDRLGVVTADIDRLTLVEPQEHEESLCGEVVYVDGYGNLVSNLARSRVEALQARFPTSRLLVRIEGSVPVTVSRTYGDVQRGALLALFGSFDMLEIAVREGNAAAMLAAGPSTQIRVRAEP
ncbi:MAG: S-adenosyl-l-methionine hydroxide adenosyltransferase family protein [Candidatus Binataceae bacterium]